MFQERAYFIIHQDLKYKSQASQSNSQLFKLGVFVFFQ